jgi:hypothetical protein
MHSLLESYLAEVRAKLSPLPLKRREEEMREMRQHLLSAMEANQELGQSADEAVASALADFGTPEKASESVLWAWRRDVRKQSIQSFWRFEGMWTVFYVFEGFQSHSITFLWAWIATLFVGALLMLVPRFQGEYQTSSLGERRERRSSPGRKRPPSP